MSKLKHLKLVLRRKPKGTATAATPIKTSSAFDATLKRYINGIDTPAPAISDSIKKRAVKSPKPISDITNATVSTSLLSTSLHLKSEDSASDFEDNDLLQGIVCILKEKDEALFISPKSQETSEDRSSQTSLDIPWYLNLSNHGISQRRKETSRVRKQKHVFKYTQVNRFQRLVSLCGQKLGSRAFIGVIAKLGRENGAKEYKAIIKLTMDEARASDDEDVILDKISTAMQYLKLMSDQGFQLDEKAYSPILMYLIDMSMAQEFNYICGEIKKCCSSIHAQLGYYEMLLYIGVDDEEKIQELCSYMSDNKMDETGISLQGYYFLALCERDRQSELLQLSEVIDITQFSSFGHVITIFKSLGRLLLESLATKFLLALKAYDYESEDISALIFSYASSTQNLAVDDSILKFKNLHSVVDVAPSAESYEKLILYSCELLKVHAALGMVDEMCKEGLTLSVGTLNSILRASEESFDFNLVQRIYSLICHHKLKIDSETLRSMISLKVKMKDFAGAYDLLDEVKNLKFTPTPSMFNAIMAGYFREKNINGAITVLKKMALAGVKPDPQTYSLLIANCDNEDHIVKYYEELKSEGIPVTKHIFMACINAYANCGLFEKAKQVLLDEGIPIKILNELKSVLVSALASHGQTMDALDVYQEIKEAGGTVEPKAVVSLIDNLQPEGDPSRLVNLLEEIKDPDYWADACMRVISGCVRNKNLNVVLNLLKQFGDRFYNAELTMQAAFDEIFAHIADSDPTDLEIGLDLLQVMKDDLCVTPSRKSLDFLLSACAKTKDLDCSLFIWKEYEAAGYPYNAMNYLKMYQALLASGDQGSAKKLLVKIPKEDTHNRMIIKACQRTYMPTVAKGKKKQKKKKIVK
ncbi:pentatricopeptide repeat-containing protein At4g04790, mitochondrial-like isoform X2 [Euphorbia lathyris]|uniref:pentatricopeptide repeat-containing protein At4g04790, mitochondrial-like isoform X2 n=1 Tax=Euphorbia lathyris TaxID=212925 RepID=UPI0033143BAE